MGGMGPGGHYIDLLWHDPLDRWIVVRSLEAGRLDGWLNLAICVQVYELRVSQTVWDGVILIEVEQNGETRHCFEGATLDLQKWVLGVRVGRVETTTAAN